jgi:transcriptional regulator with GAF, ATPase, and Fis domain
VPLALLTALPLSELLLVPLQSKAAALLGTLWVIAKEAGHFDSGHARSMSDLATFAAIALRTIQSEERLSDVALEIRPKQSSVLLGESRHWTRVMTTVVSRTFLCPSR